MSLKVQGLIDPISGDWCRMYLRNLFVVDDIGIILKDTPNIRKRDRYIWNFNRSGHYSVKSGYWLSGRIQNRELLLIAEARPSLNPLKENCWSLRTVPNIRTFIWKALNGALAVPERLHTRGLHVDRQCQVYGAANESINHIMFSCPFAR